MPVSRAIAAARASDGPSAGSARREACLGADVVAGQEHLGTDQQAGAAAGGFLGLPRAGRDCAATEPASSGP